MIQVFHRLTVWHITKIYIYSFGRILNKLIINSILAGMPQDLLGTSVAILSSVTPTQHHTSVGSSIYVRRRPSPLLKSPSFDSESSDPPNPLYPNSTCYGNEGHTSSRSMTLTHQKHAITGQLGISSISDRTNKRNFLTSAFRYRTDSETTDDQCIPESLSEEPGHDSALDTTEDIDEEEVVEEEEDLNDASPNIDGPKVPQLSFTDVAQSSTESEKTVILDFPLPVVFQETEQNFSKMPPLASMAKGIIMSSCNIRIDEESIRSSVLSLPEIVIVPGTPMGSSPSGPSSPISYASSSVSSVSIVTAAELATKSSIVSRLITNDTTTVESESTIPVSSSMTHVKCSSSGSNLSLNKSHSTPPHAISIIPNSSLEYEQLDTSVACNTSSNTANTSTAASCCSSRSESPMSDRGVIKCSSLISLHLKNIETDGNSVAYTMDYATFPCEKELKDTGAKVLKILVIYGLRIIKCNYILYRDQT